MTGLWIFLVAMIDATVIEWFGGHFIEHFYHERWWDYSKNKWNLDGYICVSHSIFWGILGYLGVRFANPFHFYYIQNDSCLDTPRYYLYSAYNIDH
mgnify:CR=1 FL=1